MDIEFFKDFFLIGFGINYAVLIIWFVMYVYAKDLIFGIHGKTFELDEKQMKAIHYGGMGILKLMAFIFYLIPYIALRLAS